MFEFVEELDRIASDYERCLLSVNSPDVQRIFFLHENEESFNLMIPIFQNAKTATLLLAGSKIFNKCIKSVDVVTEELFNVYQIIKSRNFENESVRNSITANIALLFSKLPDTNRVEFIRNAFQSDDLLLIHELILLIEDNDVQCNKIELKNLLFESEPAIINFINQNPTIKLRKSVLKRMVDVTPLNILTQSGFFTLIEQNFEQFYSLVPYISEKYDLPAEAVNSVMNIYIQVSNVDDISYLTDFITEYFDLIDSQLLLQANFKLLENFSYTIDYWNFYALKLYQFFCDQNSELDDDYSALLEKLVYKIIRNMLPPTDYLKNADKTLNKDDTDFNKIRRILCVLINIDEDAVLRSLQEYFEEIKSNTDIDTQQYYNFIFTASICHFVVEEFADEIYNFFYSFCQDKVDSVKSCFLFMCNKFIERNALDTSYYEDLIDFVIQEQIITSQITGYQASRIIYKISLIQPEIITSKIDPNSLFQIPNLNTETLQFLAHALCSAYEEESLEPIIKVISANFQITQSEYLSPGAQQMIRATLCIYIAIASIRPEIPKLFLQENSTLIIDIVNKHAERLMEIINEFGKKANQNPDLKYLIETLALIPKLYDESSYTHVDDILGSFAHIPVEFLPYEFYQLILSLCSSKQSSVDLIDSIKTTFINNLENSIYSKAIFDNTIRFYCMQTLGKIYTNHPNSINSNDIKFLIISTIFDERNMGIYLLKLIINITKNNLTNEAFLSEFAVLIASRILIKMSEIYDICNEIFSLCAELLSLLFSALPNREEYGNAICMTIYGKFDKYEDESYENIKALLLNCQSVDDFREFLINFSAEVGEFKLSRIRLNLELEELLERLDNEI